MMKKRFILIGFLAVLMFTAVPANAMPIVDNWSFNLSKLNNLNMDDSSNNPITLTGLLDATAIDHINVVGYATILQNVMGGNTANQPFVEDGYMQFSNYSKESAASTSNFALGNAGWIYLEYVALTGVMNADGSITFDTGASQLGSVDLYLSNDLSDGINSTNASQNLKLASFSLLSPSGGSDLDFYGGAGGNGTIDVTFHLDSVINPLLFTDSSGNAFDPNITLHLGNTDSLLDTNFKPNPDNSGVDSQTGIGVSLIHVMNNGQYNLAVVPEPATMLLLGSGLLGLAVLGRKKNFFKKD